MTCMSNGGCLIYSYTAISIASNKLLGCCPLFAVLFICFLVLLVWLFAAVVAAVVA